MNTTNTFKLLLLSALLLCSGNVIAQDLGDVSDSAPSKKESIKEQRKELREKFRAMKEQLHDGDDEGTGGKPFPGSGQGVKAKMLSGLSEMIKNIQDPYQAVGIALVGIKQHHKKAGNSLEAIKEFDILLSSTKEQKMRNVILFTKRQVYVEEKKFDLVLEIDKTIIKENIAAK
ncbi:MAG: hypothetical protein KBC84_07465 [Proteobacteria bacterium]|nr:hypothetical protein [Pseudomonadota bacterium]